MSTALVPVDYGTVQAMAHQLANAGDLIPKDYRGQPAKCVAAILYGAELGLGPMSALQSVVVINGKPTLSASAWTALIRQRGHSITADVTDDAATVRGRRCDTKDEMTVTFSMDDARRANLVSKGPWTQYPKSMLYARALTQLARQLFADVGFGGSIYTSEELGGEPEPVEAEVERVVSDEDVAEFKSAVGAMDEGLRDELKRWLEEKYGRRGVDKYTPGELDAAKLMAASLSGVPFPELAGRASRPDGGEVEDHREEVEEEQSQDLGSTRGGSADVTDPSSFPDPQAIREAKAPVLSDWCDRLGVDKGDGKVATMRINLLTICEPF